MSEGLPRQTSRKESHFVAPASAPPVPTTFTAAPSQADSSTGTPLPTPSLVTDVDSSMGGEDSPRVGASAENESAFARMQSHNPYFPSLPTTKAFQVASPTANMQDARSPMSPDGKDWLHTPPITHPQRISSLKGMELQNKPASTLASSGPYQSDSGSAAMSGGNASDIPSATQSARPSATRRSTTSGSSEDDDEEEEEDEYGGKSASGDDYYTSSDDDDNDDDEESEEDDLPLAQTHPDALKVQSSLRAKVRDQAKKKKRIDKTGIPKTKSARTVSRQAAAQEQLRPDGSVVSAMTAPQTACLAVVRDASVRSKTAVPPPRNPFGFAPDELSEKVRKLDASHGRLNSLRMPPKRPESAGERPHDLLLPQTDEHVQHRSRSRGRADLAPPLVPFVQDSVLTMSEGSDHEATAPLRIKKKTQTSRPAAPTAPIAQALARQSSSVASSSPASPRSPAMPQQDHSFSALHAESVQSMSHHPHHHHHGRPAFLSRQRVYINDPQHHCSVDVDENMTAGMLLAHLRGKQAISANPAWTVTEVWRAMGVERPLREYELLQESIESWATEPNSSLLLVKKSPLAPLLSSLSKNRGDVETTAGWVQLETKRGKWSKRYIEIRGEALYIGKSEKVRMSCSMLVGRLS